jgi:anti-anti-sigma regulatory factor
MLGCTDDGGELHSGDHVCWIYDSDEEHQKILTRFFGEGLRRNERVLYLARRFTAEHVTAYLQGAGIAIEEALRSGQLTVLDAEAAYLGEDGFQPERLAEACCHASMQTVVDGYRGLRAASETGWLVPEAVPPARLVEYEFRVDQVVPSLPQIGLCGYDARCADADWLLALQAVHSSRIVSPSVRQPPFAFTKVDEAIVVQGEVDQTCCKAFSLALTAAAASISPQQQPVLDLIRLQFGDLTGLRTVAQLAETLHAEGRSLVLHVPPEIARKIMFRPSAGFGASGSGEGSPVRERGASRPHAAGPTRQGKQQPRRRRSRFRQVRAVRRRLRKRR